MGCPPFRDLRSRLPALVGLLALVVASGSDAEARAPEPPPLRVVAAASLTDVVGELARRFARAPGGTPVETGFGASSVLARQIRDGAPADVFVSASADWMDFLAAAERLEGEPVVLARGRLVCIAPAGSDLVRLGVSDPRALFETLGPQGRVAIADAGVPAGEYARAALRHHGLLDAARGRLVGQKDVRAVLHAVERGGLDAGFVYATDAARARVVRLFAFDPATHPPIAYRAAALRGARDPAAARRFLAFLQDGSARALLLRAGFGLP